MTSERWQRVKEVFESALERAPGERPAFVERACAGDDSLRGEVESLLDSHRQQDSFLEAPAVAAAAHLLLDGRAESLVGRTLGHYQLVALLGEGGMGEVYLARDTRLGRHVALKLLPSYLNQDSDCLRRFEREARAASALNHPNILTVHEIGQADGFRFIATEYVDGVTLRQHMTERRMTPREILDVAAQVASALAAAHAAGIVHRDVKPENVMLRRDRLVKVLDFGLAKLTENSLGQQAVEPEVATRELAKTSPGLVIGTPHYMSPEQARGQEVDARTDVWSLGVVLYEMVAGRLPFQGETPSHVIVSIIEGEPPRLARYSEVPAELERIINKALRKDREERYQVVKDLLLDLKSLREDMAFKAKLGHSEPPALRGEAGVERTDKHPVVETADKARVRTDDAAAMRTTFKTGQIAVKNRRRGVILAVASLIVAAAGIAYLRRLIYQNKQNDQPPQGQPSLAARPLTTDRGFEGMPSLSPDGNYVAFMAGGGEQQKDYDLYVKQIGGGSPLRLTSGPAVEEFPAWSPDGRSIAFVRDKGDKLDVVLIPPIGGPERKVAEIAAPDEPQSIFSWNPPYLSWSADSKYLVTTDTLSSGEPPSLVVLSVATAEKRQLTRPPGQNDGNPAVSPDGRMLAFVRVVSVGRPQLYVLPLTADCRPAGEARHLDVPQPWVTSPTWTSDGREIVCSAGEPWEGAKGLWRVPVSGSEKPQPLTSVGDDVLQPTISRQANRLVYGDWRWDPDIWRAEIKGRGRNSLPMKLIASTHSDSEPQYSPDGSKVVFSSGRSGNVEIWMCNSDGSNPMQLTSLEARSGSPRWFPDGRRIVFDSNKEGRLDIFVIDTGSLVPRRLTDGPHDRARPSVSHDGKWIYFESATTGSPEIWRMPAEGGEPTQLTHEGGMMPFESVDGTVIYYLKQISETVSEVWKVPVSGGVETKVIGPLFQFAAAGDGIYFTQLGTRVFKGSRGNFLKFFSFARGTAEQVSDIKDNLDNGLSVSPNGRYALMTLVDHEVCDLMLVENFH